MFCTDAKHFASAESQGAIAQHLFFTVVIDDASRRKRKEMKTFRFGAIFKSFDQLILVHLNLMLYGHSVYYTNTTQQPNQFFLIKRINNIVCASKATIYEHFVYFYTLFFYSIRFVYTGSLSSYSSFSTFIGIVCNQYIMLTVGDLPIITFIHLFMQTSTKVQRNTTY